MEYTDDEVKRELEKLGYQNVSRHNLQKFRKDLEKLIQFEKCSNETENFSQLSTSKDYRYDESQHSPRENRYRAYRDYGHYGQGDVLQKSHRYSPVFDKENYDYDAYERHPTKSQRYNRHTTLSAADTRTSRAYRELDASRRYALLRDDGRDYARPLPRQAWGDEAGSPGKDSYVSEADTTASSERKIMKRKVLRKHNGKAQIFNESVTTESDPEELSTSRLADQLHHLRVGHEDEGSVISEDVPTGRVPRYFRSSMPMSGENANKKAVIMPETRHPHTQNIKKCDPVSRHQQMQNVWKANKAPGEKLHKDLRWGIREQMLYHDDVVKKNPRVYVPNSYVVPTDKKRKSLVWQVRTDMAQGKKPPVGGFS